MTSSFGNKVEADLTPVTAADVKSSIVKVLTMLYEAPVADTSWLWPLAVSANETADWKQLFNFNAGNVSRMWSLSGPYYINPHVPENTQTFASFDSLDAGISAMLRTMHKMGALAAADAGDLEAFQKAMTPYSSSYASWDPRPIAAFYENV